MMIVCVEEYKKRERKDGCYYGMEYVECRQDVTMKKERIFFLFFFHIISAHTLELVLIVYISCNFLHLYLTAID